MIAGPPLGAWFDTLFDILFPALILMVPGYFVLQVWLPRRLAGGWRVAALLPLIVFVPLLLHAAAAFVFGSNLWPLLLIFFAPVGCLYLLLLFGLHALTRP